MTSAIQRRGAGDPGASAAPGGARVDELHLIAKAAAAKDPAAAASLVMHVAPFVLKVVRSVIGRRHPDVDDIAQDAVIALLASLPAFRGESSVRHYAGRIALFTALAWRKKEHHRARRVEDDATGEALEDATSASPLAGVIASRRRQILMGLLDELPAPTADALALHFILGHTVEEIARAAAVSENTVWSRLRLGKQALFQRLSRDHRLAELLRGTP